MNNRKIWITVFVVLVLAVLLTGCGVSSENTKLPEGATKVAEISPMGGNETTVWNWCDRGTKVYFAYTLSDSVAIATSPDHKDCP